MISPNHWSKQTSTLNQLSIQENNGEAISTPSETKLHAVHAGLSDHLKHSATELPSPLKERLTSSSHPKTWSLATRPILLVTEDISTKLGPILPTQVLSQKPVSHTPQEKELLKLAPKLALELVNSPNMLAKEIPLLPPEQ